MSFAARVRVAGGAYTPIVARELVAAPNGWFNAVSDNIGYSADGLTHFAWTNGVSGDVKVATLDEATKVVTTPFVLHAALGGDDGNPDIHDGPSVWVRPDGRIVCGYSAHHGNTPIVRISTNVGDTSAFGSEITMGSTDAVTYVSLIYLSDESKLYSFYRSFSGGAGRLAFCSSTNNGASWSTRTLVFSNGANVYRRIGTNWTDRFDVAITDTDRSDGNPSSVYHFYYDGSYKKSDGTSAGSLPLNQADCTLVQDDSDGPARPLAVTLDGSDNPAILMAIYSSGNTIYRRGKWNGSSWDVTEIATTIGIMDGNRYNSAGAFEDRNPDVVWVHEKVGSIFEIFRYEWTGAAWEGHQVTISSADDNGRPEAVAFGSVIWGQGDYTSDQNFDMAVWGYF